MDFTQEYMSASQVQRNQFILLDLWRFSVAMVKVVFKNIDFAWRKVPWHLKKGEFRMVHSEIFKETGGLRADRREILMYKKISDIKYLSKIKNAGP